MSKELKALEKLIDMALEPNGYLNFQDAVDAPCYKIVENALLEKEGQDKIIETLKDIIQFNVKLPEIKFNDNGSIESISSGVSLTIQRHIENKKRELFREWILKECFPKELRALAIIREKKVDTLLLFRCFEIDNKYGCSHIEVYNLELYTIKITQEEYDLLKEVLL